MTEDQTVRDLFLTQDINNNSVTEEVWTIR